MSKRTGTNGQQAALPTRVPSGHNVPVAGTALTETESAKRASTAVKGAMEERKKAQKKKKLEEKDARKLKRRSFERSFYTFSTSIHETGASSSPSCVLSPSYVHVGILTVGAAK